MKSVLISIQPKWCELIASGKKTVEVRKTKPKLETPFKVYIYCTSSNVHECLMQNESGVKFIRACNYKTAIPIGGQIANGKVIGEFVCDAIFPISCYYSDVNARGIHREQPYTCLTDKEMIDYLGNGVEGYGWHISDLVIYDEPKRINEFVSESILNTNCFELHLKRLDRPPQSWCYVEEVEQ